MDEPHREPVIDRGMNLNAHLGDHALMPGNFGHPAHFIKIVRERFLTIDMFAQLHRGDANRRVHVVGRGDVDGINIVFLAFQQFPPVLIKPGVRKLF